MIITKNLLSKLHLAVIDKTHNLFTLFFDVNQTHIVEPLGGVMPKKRSLKGRHLAMEALSSLG